MKYKIDKQYYDEVVSMIEDALRVLDMEIEDDEADVAEMKVISKKAYQCESCGGEVQYDFAFCPHCGVRFAKEL